ncbi:MAG: ABC transporter ATP-binding protein [Planctomycetes bacterium]|nr:ABC transporter ATP-binding protein [Planctomycetota bacterium]
MRIVIELQDIAKIYDPGAAEVRALNGVSLKIGAGEFVTIRGSSGSGKSTLMNILGCLDRPTHGEYYLDGENTQILTRTALAHLRNRKLGFVFQGFNLLKRMSAIENVEMPLVYSGLSPARRRAKALGMLDLVGLSHRAFHMPNQMSGGQQQRAAIARALVNDPQILFADEPTGNLDSKTGQEILAEFERLNRELGQTIVMVTHDVAVAERAPRQITVRDGVIASDIRRLPDPALGVRASASPYPAAS